MTAELERLERVPNTVEKEWREKKRLWSEVQKRLEAIESKVEEDKKAASRNVSAFETEAASLATKQDRLSTRLAKLKADMDKLKSENTAAQLEKVKKKADQEALVKHRATLEQEFSSAISKLEKKMQEYRTESSENWAMVMTFESAAAAAAAALQAQQCPTPLEGSLPGTGGSLGPVGVGTPIISTLNANLRSTPPGFGPVMPNLIPSNPPNHRRDRASSMFTGDSRTPNFADITPRDRPSLPSLNSFGGVGSGPFEGGVRRSNSQNTRSSLGSIGAVNAAPGFEKFGSGTTSQGNSVLDR